MATTTTNYGLTKPAYADTADIEDINGNMDTVDTALGGIGSAVAAISDGDTHDAIAEGGYVYVRNHSTLAEGMYEANSAIPANDPLTNVNLTASGDLANKMKDTSDQIGTINKKFTDDTAAYVNLNNCTTLAQVMDLVDANDSLTGIASTGDSETTNFKSLVGATSLSNYDYVIVKRVTACLYLAVASSCVAASAVKVKWFRRGFYAPTDTTRMSQTAWVTYSV